MIDGRPWICCQLGGREHYAVPRAIVRAGRLQAMITDAWVRPGSLLAHVPGDTARRLGERFHPDLENSSVCELTVELARQEIAWRLRGLSGWPLFLERNEWFQQAAVNRVRTMTPPARGAVMFAHSYAARDLFRHARERGWTTVLGQIDPGEQHFVIARALSAQSPQYGPPPPSPPPEYFERWHEECALADHIVVNSEWSRECLVRAGIEGAKIRLVPLAYEGPAAVAPRSYPDRFSASRPLKLLFAGSVSVIKGAPVLLDAMARLRDRPVTLRLVGERGMDVPAAALADPALEWVGPVSRSEIFRHYRECDALIFPTHSDGFGMVQVEAQACGLPIVASRSCGRVVDDGINGVRLDSVSPAPLADAIAQLVDHPERLTEYSRHAASTTRFSISALSEALAAAVPA